MFAHLKGIIEKTDLDHLVIDVNGVGYFVSASRLTLSQLTKGDVIKLHIETLMRQEALHLFGFLTQEEHAWFRLLLTVQGVGPKLALGIVGSLGLQELAQAITHQDKVTLNRAEGVGPKLAGRLLLELKDKLHIIDTSSMTGSILPSAPTTTTPAMEDALSALINLGYSRIEARTAFSALDKDKHIDDALRNDSAALIHMALQHLHQKKAG